MRAGDCLAWNGGMKLPGHVLVTPFLKEITDSLYSVHIAFLDVIHDCYAANAIILSHADALTCSRLLPPK